MGLMDFASEIETNFVNDIDGLAEDISFIYRGGSSVNTRAFVEDGDYRASKDNVVEDTTSFLSVKLPSLPRKGDVVLYRGVRWYVTNYKGHTLYDLVCSSSRSHETSRAKKGL